ncbi:glycine dehydrogenase (aminomethyl-transferring) [candidate division WOR-3 bacterium JGI_Cruoil_03_51_56]|uniref:Probable glycine dehydrogenase (decarboxylating) subunit 2 n=1 Tax=candidate division WOR-3 bacterium JGI_Cruoil_03_51_56 TaxID=1973747 RepID=A0A235BRX6_UNCW3|nr:MAG: glycine dehydrogenase (aminomethyl-transferring) [candidate division WOR-3 bacterium JGI_Cruoil_03_51_56]
MNTEPTLFELSKPGRKAWTLPKLDVPGIDPKDYFGNAGRKDSRLPELSEIDIARHFTRLSILNHHIDKGLYPLGSCTMKYNPKINERASRLPGFAEIHPLLPETACQGALQLMYELGEYLKEITGFDAITLQPGAGAHGELTGMMMVRKYFEKKGEKRTRVLVPDSAHGTNPASITLAGFKVEKINSDEKGQIDLKGLENASNQTVACLMVTNPNTLGIFESRIRRICEIMHSKGALVYLDGANLNAYMGIHRPGDAGFDLMHMNLHKTFSTPHGGGGPGGGPVAVKSWLEPFLPKPVIRHSSHYWLDYDRPDSIGKVLAFSGHFGVFVKAWTYIRMLGPEGLRDASECAVLNANYIRAGLEGIYELPYKGHSLHEVVFSGSNLRQYGIRTLDIAKGLLDYGLHAPTVYFPLIVSEAMLIEPTETESLESLDDFIKAMKEIAEQAKTNPDRLHNAPLKTPVQRLDEALASRKLDVNYEESV